ncbi:hypothetical protein BS50DRAFT_583954 [Corynespora cassiicola Philippines]|uniref:Uncharacterized protein n=1 Tax=Corynespora cassiicola Philippines TaxID=1448308 RepID=A0A2T2P406_CORCC|nr:hypothetical protein BS50DRAFT_583954 [Corynespora cassiicola Philippines]
MANKLYESLEREELQIRAHQKCRAVVHITVTSPTRRTCFFQTVHTINCFCIPGHCLNAWPRHRTMVAPTQRTLQNNLAPKRSSTHENSPQPPLSTPLSSSSPTPPAPPPDPSRASARAHSSASAPSHPPACASPPPQQPPQAPPPFQQRHRSPLPSPSQQRHQTPPPPPSSLPPTP